MVYDPNANWTARLTAAVSAPVYFLRIDGLASKDFSTDVVRAPTRSKSILMEPPKGGGGRIQPIDGTLSKGRVNVTLVDVDGEVTDLISTDANGAPLAALINRKATVYLGFRDLDESDYAPIFPGRITKVVMSNSLTSYVISLSPVTHLLDQKVMTGATSTKPSTITGNVCNCYGAILRGVFSVSDPDFPLDSVSIDDGSNSAPTGLGLAAADVNVAQIKSERDLWHPSDKVTVKLDDPVEAGRLFTAELFRAFQCFPAVDATGKIGLKFLAPPLSPVSIPTVTVDDDIIKVTKWGRLYDDHLNKFRVLGDYNLATEVFDATLYDTEVAEDTADQAATDETIEYLLESKWLTAAQNGATIASELAARMRLRYLTTPAEIRLSMIFDGARLEEGDTIALTDHRLPDLLEGTVGVAGQLMMVVQISPDFDEGVVVLTLLDTNIRRYGVIAPSGTLDYTAEDSVDQSRFVFISGGAASATPGRYSNGDQGHRLI